MDYDDGSELSSAEAAYRNWDTVARLFVWATVAALVFYAGVQLDIAWRP